MGYVNKDLIENFIELDKSLDQKFKEYEEWRKKNECTPYEIKVRKFFGLLKETHTIDAEVMGTHGRVFGMCRCHDHVFIVNKKNMTGQIWVS